MGIIDSGLSLLKKGASSKVGKFVYWKLEKLKIQSYDNEDCTLNRRTFEAMFNPDTFSLAYENVYSKQQGINTSGSSARYAMSRPASLSLKLIVDGNDTAGFNIPGMDGFVGLNGYTPAWVDGQDVTQRVRWFLKLTTEMNGESHEPHFLVIEWGILDFRCRLKTVNINYTMFDKSGMPLRAELDAVFIGSMSDKMRMMMDSKSSPDLTHKRIVKAHDTLPLLCQEIYGSGDYYLKVARANNLDDFRNLVPGQELFFPPIETGS